MFKGNGIEYASGEANRPPEEVSRAEKLRRAVHANDEGEQVLRVHAISLSDFHFFTHAENDANMRGALDLLYRTECKYLFLPGDIYDIWRRREKNHKPLTEIEARIIDCINAKAAAGTIVVMTEGNHEAHHAGAQEEGKFLDALRGRAEFENYILCRGYDFIDPQGRKILVTHGDQFDPPFARGLYSLGSHAYDVVAAADKINPFLACVPHHLRRKFSLAAHGKALAKKIYIEGFERNVVAMLPEGYGGVLMGHIHQEAVKEMVHPKTGQPILYINDGDCTESVSAAICFEDGEWTTSRWFEDRRMLGLGSIPHLRDAAPEKYQRFRSLTEKQVDIIQKIFPARDFAARWNALRDFTSSHFNQTAENLARAVSDLEHQRILESFDLRVADKVRSLGLQPIREPRTHMFFIPSTPLPAAEQERVISALYSNNDAELALAG